MQILIMPKIIKKRTLEEQGLSRRKFLLLTGASCASLALTGCGGGGGIKSTPSRFTYKFPNNITDGRIFLATSKKDGRVFTYFADKDSKGNATNLRAVQSTANGATELMYFDPDHKRLTKIVLSNGVTLDLNWQAVGQAVLTLNHTPSNSSISTLLNFTTQSLPSKTLTLSSAGTRNNNQLRATQTHINQVTSSLLSTGTGNCVVDVSRCGMPDTSPINVFVSVGKKDLGVAYASYPAFPIGNGKYVANIPTANKKILNLREAAMAALEAVKDVCEPFAEFKATAALEYFCASIAEAVAVAPTGFNQAAGASFLGVCTIFNGFVTGACEVISNPAGQVVTEGISELLEAGALDTDVDLTPEIDLTARVVALPSDIIGSTKTASSTGPFPNLSVSLGSTPEISSFTLDPPAPAAQQPYNATVRTFCLSVGDVVTLSIVGTDGYSKSQTFNVSSADMDQQFVLNVPGALTSGIRDVVSVRVESNGKSPLTASRFLVFQ